MRCAARARSVAELASYLDNIVLERQPASRMRSSSEPPSANQWWAKVCRNRRAELADAGPVGPSAEQLRDARDGHAALLAEPQLGLARVGVLATDADVPIEGLRDLPAEGDRSRPPALA